MDTTELIKSSLICINFYEIGTFSCIYISMIYEVVSIRLDARHNFYCILLA